MVIAEQALTIDFSKDIPGDLSYQELATERQKLDVFAKWDLQILSQYIFKENPTPEKIAIIVNARREIETILEQISDVEESQAKKGLVQKLRSRVTSELIYKNYKILPLMRKVVELIKLTPTNKPEQPFLIDFDRTETLNLFVTSGLVDLYSNRLAH